MTHDNVERIIEHCIEQAREMFAAVGEVSIYSLVVSGNTMVVAAPTAAMSKDEYALALARFANTSDAEAVFVVAESWALDIDAADIDATSSLAEVPAPSRSPRRVECLSISFKTREGRAGVRLVNINREGKVVALDTTVRSLTMTPSASFNRYLDAVFRNTVH